MLELSSRYQTDEIEIINLKVFETQMESSHRFFPTQNFLLTGLEVDLLKHIVARVYTGE